MPTLPLTKPTPRAMLSYRLAHHLPDALPFLVPFLDEAVKGGFTVDSHSQKPVLRGNGVRLVITQRIENAHQIVDIHRWGKKATPIATLNLTALHKDLRGGWYLSVHATIQKTVTLMRQNVGLTP